MALGTTFASCSTGDQLIGIVPAALDGKAKSNGGSTEGAPPSNDGAPVLGGGGSMGGQMQCSDPRECINEGVVAYFPFDDGLADEGGNRLGTVISESGNDVAFVDGVRGRALDLSGGNEHVTVPFDSDLTPEEFSLVFWAKSPGAGPDFQEVLLGIGRDCYNGYFCGIYPDQTIKCALNDNRGWCNDAISVEGAWPEDRWVHIAFVVEQKPSPPIISVRLYLDGALVDDQNLEDYYSVGDPRRPFVFGAHYMEEDGVGVAPYYSKAQIDEVRLYNRTLSEREITFLKEMMPSQ